jgi:hypothetical protein
MNNNNNNNNNNFEFLLVETIIKSLKNEPEIWETSIMGLRRIKDQFELNVSTFNNVEIHKPYSYKFKDDNLMKKLHKEAKNLQNIKYDILKNEKDKENIKKISEFLNINTRRNKLIALEKLEDSKEAKIELKINFFKKLFKNIF